MSGPLRLSSLLLLGTLLACGGDTPQMTDSQRPEAAHVWFSEEAEARGLVSEYASGNAGRPLMPEIVGGGVAVLDVDNDADMDVYLVQAGFTLEQGRVDQSSGNRLFLNRGDGYFDEQSIA